MTLARPIIRRQVKESTSDPMILSNLINERVQTDKYCLDPSSIFFMTWLAQKIKLPHIDIKEEERLVKFRHRNDQTPELLSRLQSAITKCRPEHRNWMEKRKSRPDVSCSINYDALTNQDMLDLCLMPDDHILDSYGEKPIDGPAFLDVRDGQLFGACVRNISTDLKYAGEAKYTFTNHGWFLWNVDRCNKNDQTFIVEGVFDAIAMGINGIQAIAVGSCAPTPYQLSFIASRYKNVAVCFDNDIHGKFGAYVTSKLLKCDIYIPKLKDVATYVENDLDIELKSIKQNDLYEQMEADAKSYNMAVANGELVRPLPYNVSQG